MFDAITLWKYGGVLAALLAAGFGAPIPEEIPVVTAGAMVGHDAQAVADYDTLSDAYEVAGAVGGGPIAYLAPQPPAHLTRWWLMLLVCIVGVVIGDTVIYTVGRVWGPSLMANGWIQRHVLPPDKQHKIEANFAKNGIMILLGARLTPGIRTPVFLMAGVLRMPVQRFLLADALYAVPGVNLLFWLAYLFTDQFVAAVTAVEKHRPLVLVAVLAAVGGVVLYKLLVGRTLSTGAVEEIPAVVKPVGVVTQAVEQAIEKTVGKTVETAAKVVDKVIHPHGHPAAPHGPAPSADGRGSAVPGRVSSGNPSD